MSGQRFLGRFRGLAAALICGAAFAAIGSASALAGVITVTDPRGDVTGGRLTAKERAAIDITSVTISGEEGLGVLVTVELAGNFTSMIGRGHLGTASAELLLRSASPDLAPARIATQGPGPIGETIRQTTSKLTGVVRHGRKLSFVIFGPGFSNVSTAEVRILLSGNARATAGQGKPPADTTGPINVPKAGLTCSELVDELDRVEADIEKAKASKKKAEEALEKATQALSDVKERLATLKRHLTEEKEYLKKTRKRLAKELAKTPFEDEDLIASLESDIASSAKGIASLEKDVIPSVENVIADLEKFKSGLKEEIETEKIVIDALEAVRKEIKAKLRQCKPPGTLGAVFEWQNFGPGEVKGTGSFVTLPGRTALAAAAGPLDAVKVVVPGERQIVNFLCPSQLPTPAVSTTTSTNDTLTCSGGSLPVGEQFSLNVRTTPGPAAGMGGQLFGRQAGFFNGPFQINGP